MPPRSSKGLLTSRAPISATGMSSVLRLRSGCGGVRGAHACFKLSEDLLGHVELSGHRDGVADSTRGRAARVPASAPRDSLHGDVPAEPVIEGRLPNAMHLIQMHLMQMADVVICVVFRDSSYHRCPHPTH
jgi:hypothetical protein